MRTLINVSNRLPVTVGETIRKSSGGLVAAMEALSEEDYDLKWIGWPGAPVESKERQRELSTILQEEHGCSPVFLSEEEISLYYHGYSNSSLWPILHYMPNYMRHETEWWEAYKEVNQRFADAVVNSAGEGDMVWVHDYHLMLLPAMLRERRPDLRIGFFLHTPFPSYEIFRCHPQRRELLEGMLGADQVGFHTFGYTRHFRSSVLRVLDIEPDMGHVFHSGQNTHLGVYPIGINSKKFQNEFASDKFKQKMDRLRELYRNKRLVLSVERLDYTKGIVHRLAAIDRFLNRHEHKNEICFLMISVPSRGEVQQYQELRDEVEHLVGKINGAHATVHNVPVHFIFQSVDFTELCALYRLADIALVTPLIDGMNLVAKEYVACQESEGGVLILSEFAGAAQELSDAITVNPYDVQGVARHLASALELPDNRKSGAMRKMRERVLRYDACHWAKSFIKDLVARDRAEDVPIEGADVQTNLIERIKQSPLPHAFCLDYDGTLREFESTPGAAEPTEEIHQLLRALADTQDLEVMIVSGRQQQDLEKWLGQYPFTLVCEHGVAHRPATQSDWESLVPGIDLTWKADVLPIFRHYEDSTPGSRIEEKYSTVVWHYRQSDPEFGQWKASELIGELYETVSNLPVEIHHGKSIIEVSSMQITKGAAIEALLSTKRYGFVLTAGDDQTDETMFTRDIPNMTSVKVGKGDTMAKYRVRSPKALRNMLMNLIEACQS